MKIALPICKKSEQGNLSERLGRAEYLAICDDNNIEIIENAALSAVGGAGIQTAQFLSDAGVEVLLALNVGPKARQAIAAADIKIYCGIKGTIAENLTAYANGELEQLK